MISIEGYPLTAFFILIEIYPTFGQCEPLRVTPADPCSLGSHLAVFYDKTVCALSFHYLFQTWNQSFLQEALLL